MPSASFSPKTGWIFLRISQCFYELVSILKTKTFQEKLLLKFDESY